MLNNISIKAGEFTEITKQGSNINVVLAAGEITVRIRFKSGQVQQTKLVSGMSFDTLESYISVAFSSDVSQKVKVWLSDMRLTYSPIESRNVGSSAIDSSSEMVYYATPNELISAQSGRGKVTINSKEDIYIGGTNLNAENAIKVSANENFELSTQGAIFAYSLNKNLQPKQTTRIQNVEDLTFTNHIAGWEKIHVNSELGVMYAVNSLDSSVKKIRLSDMTTQKIYSHSGQGRMHDQNSKSGAFEQYDGSLFFVVSKAGNTSLMKIDLENDLLTEVSKLSSVGGDIQDLYMDIGGGKISAVIEISGTNKVFAGDLNSISESTLTLTDEPLCHVWVTDQHLIVYAGATQSSSHDGGVTWEPVIGTEHSIRNGVFRDKVSGKIYHFQQYEHYESVDGISWWSVYRTGGYNTFSAFVSGDVRISVGERNLIYVDGNNEPQVYNINTKTGLAVNSCRSVSVGGDGKWYVIDGSKGLFVFSGATVEQVGGLPVAIMSEVN